MQRTRSIPKLSWLAAYRIRAGLTAAELAEAAGISRPSMSKLESGRMQPSMETAKALSRVLRVSVEALFPGDDVPTPMDCLAPHMEKRRKARV